MDVSVTRHGGISLYILPRTGPGDTPGALTEAAASELGDLLMTQRLALDRLADAPGVETDEGLAPYVSLLYRNYYRAKRLHDHIAAISDLRRESPAFSPRAVALEEVFGDVCDTVRSLMEIGEKPAARLTFEGPDESCVIRGDRRQLETLLFNLLANSLLHTHGDRSVRVSLTRQGQRCVLAVDDSGTGIPPERLSSLLTGGGEPDRTDPGAGMGLGLTLARGIAELHGGALIIESRRDIGTRLRVSFPLLAPADTMSLRQTDPGYRSSGMDLALTELSVVLDKKAYTRKLFD